MCGIVGYVGFKTADKIIFDGLARMEYRGYDSVGVAYLDQDGLHRRRVVGGVKKLKQEMRGDINASSLMIGHTRWATHGKVSVVNAHPQMDTTKNVAVVHNGIIENYAKIKDDLIKKGVVFRSDTDTEVIPNLIYQELKNKNLSINNILVGIQKTCQTLRGSFALCILIKGIDKMFVAARFSPLMLSCSCQGCMVASDTIGLSLRGKVFKIPDDTIAVVDKQGFNCYDLNLRHKQLTSLDVNQTFENTSPYPYNSFMEKEINENSKAIENTIKTLTTNRVLENLDDSIVHNVSKVVVCACGTALHAGRLFASILEKSCGQICVVDYASEFRYRQMPIDKHTVCLFISQSGETADTLSCAELAHKKGAYCVGMTNVPTSRLVSLVDCYIPTCAGAERAVASTKAFMAQMCALYLLNLKFCEVFGKKAEYNSTDLLKVPNVLKNKSIDEFLCALVPKLANLEHLYVLGRGLDYVIAMEGALKIKEISYIHCESMPLGELKHGSLALFDSNTYAIVLMTQSSTFSKVLNNICEIQSRGAKVVVITTLNVDIKADYCLRLPPTIDCLSVFEVTPVLQKLALLLAESRNLNVDKPRNLAKSVTVE